eukprot:788059-Pelagomonas_calceolata.AAC.1
MFMLSTPATLISKGTHTPRAAMRQTTLMMVLPRLATTQAGAGAGGAAGGGDACTQVRLTANMAQLVHARTAPSRWVVTFFRLYVAPHQGQLMQGQDVTSKVHKSSK